MVISLDFEIYNPFIDEKEEVFIEVDISFYLDKVFDADVSQVVSKTGVDLIPELSEEALYKIRTDIYEHFNGAELCDIT